MNGGLGHNFGMSKNVMSQEILVDGMRPERTMELFTEEVERLINNKLGHTGFAVKGLARAGRARKALTLSSFFSQSKFSQSKRQQIGWLLVLVLQGLHDGFRRTRR